jgi:hypothetical protein
MSAQLLGLSADSRTMTEKEIQGIFEKGYERFEAGLKRRIYKGREPAARTNPTKSSNSKIRKRGSRNRAEGPLFFRSI